MAAPSGSDLNPARLDWRYRVPSVPQDGIVQQTLERSVLADGMSDEDSMLALSAVVTREGSVADLSVLANSATASTCTSLISTRSRRPAPAAPSSAAIADRRQPGVARRADDGQSRPDGRLDQLAARLENRASARPSLQPASNLPHRLIAATAVATLFIASVARMMTLRPGFALVERHLELLAARVRNPVLRIDHPPAAGVERVLDALHGRLLVADGERDRRRACRCASPAAPRSAAACCRCRS